MQVILLEKIKNLGDVGNVVDVKSGYARNFLLPREKCIVANKSNIAYFESRRQEVEKQNQEKLAAALEEVKKYEGNFYVIYAQASDDENLFGSVTNKDIAAQAGVNKNVVIIPSPIKSLGVHTVLFELHAEASANVNIVVARTEDEALRLKNEFETAQKEDNNNETQAPAEGGDAETDK